MRGWAGCARKGRLGAGHSGGLTENLVWGDAPAVEQGRALVVGSDASLGPSNLRRPTRVLLAEEP